MRCQTEESKQESASRACRSRETGNLEARSQRKNRLKLGAEPIPWASRLLCLLGRAFLISGPLGHFLAAPPKCRESSSPSFDSTPRRFSRENRFPSQAPLSRPAILIPRPQPSDATHRFRSALHWSRQHRKIRERNHPEATRGRTHIPRASDP